MNLGKHHQAVPAYAIDDMRDQMRDLKNEKLTTKTQILPSKQLFNKLNRVSLHHEFLYRWIDGIR